MHNVLAYTGRKARDYEAKRASTNKWQLENEAVAALLPSHACTVLDVPVGTGRFAPLYRYRRMTIVGVDVSLDMLDEARAKGLEDLRWGDIRDLKFDNDTFDFAVCIRLANWLTPEDLSRALAEMARVAHSVIIGIRLRPVAELKSKLWRHAVADFHECVKAVGLEVVASEPIDAKGYYILRLVRCA